MINLTQTIAPTDRPVDLPDLKKHTNIDSTADDNYLLDLLDVAIETVESEVSKQLITATFTYTLDTFPASGGDIVIPVSPVTSVTSVTYTDEAGNGQTWSSSKYETDVENSRIRPLSTESYPTIDTSIKNVVVTFVAGYATPSVVPTRLKHAIKLLVAHWFAAREAFAGTPFTFKELPMGFERLIRPFRNPL